MGHKRPKYPNRDHWKTDERLFYRLSGTGHDPDRERPKDRCYGYLDASHLTFGALWTGKPIRDWIGATLVVEEELPLDDMPWNTSDALIVSDRLKRLFERVAPDQAQYLPIAVKRASWALIDLSEFRVFDETGYSVPDANYWVVNTLVELDCMNWECASRDVWGTSIQPEKVPKDIALFRIQGQCASAYCRRELRVLCDEAGIRGPQFRYVHAAASLRPSR